MEQEDEEQIPCNFCSNKLFSGTKAELKAHLIHAHCDWKSMTLRCPLCLRSFCRFEEQFWKHHEEHTYDKVAKNCPIPTCGSFESWRSYRKHILGHALNNGKTFPCHLWPDFCDFEGTDPGSWIKHVTTDVERFCEKCKIRFRYPFLLQQHVNNNHMAHVRKANKKSEVNEKESSRIRSGIQLGKFVIKPLSTGIFHCPLCPKKTYKSEMSIRTHMKNHHLIYLPHKCSHCGGLLATKNAVRYHCSKDNHEPMEATLGTPYRSPEVPGHQIGLAKYEIKTEPKVDGMWSMDPANIPQTTSICVLEDVRMPEFLEDGANLKLEDSDKNSPYRLQEAETIIGF